MIYDHDPWNEYYGYSDNGHAGVEPPLKVRQIERITCLTWGVSGIRALLTGQLGSVEPYHGDNTEIGRQQARTRTKESGHARRRTQVTSHAQPPDQARRADPPAVAPSPPPRDRSIRRSSVRGPEPVADASPSLGREDWPKSQSITVTRFGWYIGTDNNRDRDTLIVPWGFGSRE